MLDNEWETLAELLKAPVDPSRRVLAGPVGRLQALHWITRAATSSLDLDEMLSTVARVLRETMRADSCGIFLYDESSGTLTLRAVDGVAPDRAGRFTLPLGVGITGQAALTRRLQIAFDAPRHPAYVDYPHVDDRPFASQVSVPLIARQPGRLLGVLNILTLEPREFWPEEIDFLETAAGEIAIAIENAMLYSETDAELRRRIAQLELLQQLWRAIASTLDLDELLATIAGRAIELSGARGVAIFRQSRSKGGGLELLRAAPLDWAQRHDVLVERALRGVVQDVLDSGAAVWRELDEVGVAVYALPMITGRRAVGALCLAYPLGTTQPAQTGLLHAFTDTAAIAIENAELYEEARRGLARASTLLRELHHRVRNNLQTVAALLSLQARRAGPEARAVLQDAVSRIRSLTVVHDLLSGREMPEVSLVELARIVVTQAVHSLYGDDVPVAWTIEGDEVAVSSRQTTVLALLLNEFVTNAVRHGFQDGPGRLAVRVRAEGERAVLEVEDDGRGLPVDFDPLRGRGLGLQIARTLVEVDLRGELEIGPAADGGTLVRVRFVPEGQVVDRATVTS
ncbi:MAG: GAF domain-containing protein [Thermomicrobium sp.]|nr:GAF domain-containing protein [Thermomicrobium sp.]MDW8059815.1 GAF domain-containing protein [Thermomicrobium sp.]